MRRQAAYKTRGQQGEQAVARRAMKIAAGICIYTNESVTVEIL